MFDQFIKETAELIARGESFVTATVVRAIPPTSGKPGDKAIIHADGRISGWIGGGCAQPVVIKEAMKAQADGRPDWCGSAHPTAIRKKELWTTQ